MNPLVFGNVTRIFMILYVYRRCVTTCVCFCISLLYGVFAPKNLESEVNYYKQKLRLLFTIDLGLFYFINFFIYTSYFTNILLIKIIVAFAISLLVVLGL